MEGIVVAVTLWYWCILSGWGVETMVKGKNGFSMSTVEG